MSVEMLAIVVTLLLLALVSIELPVGVAMIVAGGVGVLVHDGAEGMLNLWENAPYGATAKYALVVVPMFVLLGAVVSHAGIGERIFAAFNRLVGWLPGGLAASTVLATAMFSGISGSSAADVAAFGRVAINQMGRHGYDKTYAAAVVAAAGTFAVLIPPSIGIIIYALLAEVSIGAMLLAGVLPGITSCLILAAFVILQSRKRVRNGVAAPAETVSAETVSAGSASAESAGAPALEPPRRVGLRDLFRRGEGQAGSDFSGLVYAVVLFVIVMGGLYSGFFTSTESGAVGAAAALLMAILAVRFWPRRLVGVVVPALRDTASITSMIFLLLIGGTVFNYFTATTGIARDITTAIANLGIPGKLTIVLLLVVLLLLGTVMDGLTIMLLTVPLVAPIITELGFDGIWFGILMLKMVEIGLITPPVGLNVYIISGIVPDVRAEQVFRKIAPFVVLDLAVTSLFFLFPDFVLWLPRQAGLA
ncbi:TRAP transporter large permease [Actinophytocola sp.]|uniref:TRAP transporter large permease n=1 Tax=Actinophytocola sp. TaxID=1872138 RepID=UPI003D6BFABF